MYSLQHLTLLIRRSFSKLSAKQVSHLCHTRFALTFPPSQTAPSGAFVLFRANSSAVEHLVYTEAVGGSNPSSRTSFKEKLSLQNLRPLSRGATHDRRSGLPVRRKRSLSRTLSKSAAGRFPAEAEVAAPRARLRLNSNPSSLKKENRYQRVP